MPIHNLIIDLGGVLYATDQDAAYAAFRQLMPTGKGPASLPSDLRHLAEYPLFRDLETGESSPAKFREALRSEMGVVGTDADIDHAWNSLLAGVIPGRVEDLQTLSASYRMVLLSNTNAIHAQAFAEEVRDLFACFEHCYLSFEMGLRKPSVEIYQQVLKESKMRAEESLFVDDSEINIAGAVKAGLNVFHLSEEPGGRWEELLKQLRR